MTNAEQDWSGRPWDHLAGPWQDIRRRAATAASAAGAGVGIPRDDLRIGDAERHEMSEMLSRHFAEGRLDESEFQERVEQAMRAKTRGDLRGLLSDLPPIGSASGAASVPQPRFHRRHRIARSIVLVTAAVLVIGALLSPMYPRHAWWLVAVVAVMLAVNRGPRWHRHHHHHHGGHNHENGGFGASPPPA